MTGPSQCLYRWHYMYVSLPLPAAVRCNLQQHSLDRVKTELSSKQCQRECRQHADLSCENGGVNVHPNLCGLQLAVLMM